MTYKVNAIAIVIPMYNASKTIERAIDSVLSQTYPHWHIYLINDKSTDHSLSLVREKYTDPRITILDNEVNLGAAETRNVGLRAAKEQVIAFLDSDDEWQPEKLAEQVAALENGDNFVITHYNYKTTKADYEVSYNKPYLTAHEFVKKNYRVCFSSVCFRRPAKDVYFEKKGHEDFLFLHNLFTAYKKAKVINRSLVNYYEIENSLSRNKNKAAKWHLELLKIIFNGNPIKVYYYYCWYMFNGVLFSLKHR